jgi:hypothetical protein
VDISSPAQLLSDESLEAARRTALDAIDGLLTEQQRLSLSAAKDTFSASDLSERCEKLAGDFREVLGSLGDAGSTDSTLGALVADFRSRSAHLRGATDALRASKAAGVLFEGAERLKRRTSTLATALLSDGGLRGLQASTGSLLARLSDGEDALLRLKGLELGDSLRERLAGAVRAAAASGGGLDALIEGALEEAREGASALDGDVGRIIAEARAKAGEAGEGNEALLSLLGRRSEYADAIVSGLEVKLHELDGQLALLLAQIPAAARGELEALLEPGSVLSLASGSRGTQDVFGPIAAHAKRQLKLSLDEAEAEYGGGEAAAAALEYARGLLEKDELDIEGLVGDALGKLNDGEAVGKAEGAIMKAE